MSNREVNPENVVSDNVKVTVHNIDDLRREVDDWDSLSKQEKLEASRDVDPMETIEDHNTTVDGLNEYIVDNLDPSQSVNEDASHLEVGSDGNTTPTTSDTGMNTSVGTFSVTSDSDNGKDLFTSTFLDTSQANGNTLAECGLTTASSGGTLLNHSTFTDFNKTSSNTFTLDVTLSFRAD